MKIFATIEITPEEWAELRDHPPTFGLEMMTELAHIWHDEIVFSLAKEMKAKTPELLPHYIKKLEEGNDCSTYLREYLKEELDLS